MPKHDRLFKEKAVARLLPPENAPAREVAQELGIAYSTLIYWRGTILCETQNSSQQTGPSQDTQPNPLSSKARQTWTGASRFEAILATAVLDETSKGAWCRERGIYLKDLERWRTTATQALANPESPKVSSSENKENRNKIRKLEQELRRKDKALAETAALLVLSKKVEAIFQKNTDGDV